MQKEVTKMFNAGLTTPPGFPFPSFSKLTGWPVVLSKPTLATIKRTDTQATICMFEVKFEVWKL